MWNSLRRNVKASWQIGFYYRVAVGRLFYIDGIILHGDGRPYFLDTYGILRAGVHTGSQPPLMNPGYLPGKLMCAYHVFVRPWPLYQRNWLTFDKIGYYYPFLLSPQGVVRPALARCFVLSSFNCRPLPRRQVRIDFGKILSPFFRGKISKNKLVLVDTDSFLLQNDKKSLV